MLNWSCVIFTLLHLVAAVG